MKSIAILIFSCITLTNSIYSQDNLITTNPDFISDVSGWSASGDVNFTHTAQGALTPGAAELDILTTAGGWGNAQITSDSYQIPNNLNDKLLFLSLHAKSDFPKQIRIRFSITDNTGTTRFINHSYQLNTDFQEHSLPVPLSTSDVSFKFNLQCGLETGVYSFDDISFSYLPVPLENISQFNHWVPRSFSKPATSTQQTLSTGSPTTEVSIDINNTLAPVLPTQFGVNSNFRSGNSLSSRAHLYEEFGSFRFPAGSGSDIYFWDCNIPSSFAIPINGICGTSSTANRLSASDFATFKQNAIGEATVVVNYGYARYGTTPSGTREDRVNQAAAYAAAFVQELNINQGANIKYWEIGNETYGNWEPGYDVNGSIVTGKEYGEDLRVFSDAMKAIDPTIWVGAVISHSRFDWNAQVLREVEDHADFLIVHNYYVNVASSEESGNAIQKMANNMQEIQRIAKKNTNKPLGHFPVTMTEFNSQGDHTTTIANGLFVADALGHIIKNKFTLSSIWVNEWGLSGTGNNHSHGILAKSDPGQPDYSPRPSYTPYYYYSRCFGDQMVESVVTGNSEVKSHASTFSSGEIGLVLLNYSNTAQDVAISYAGMSNNDTVYWYSVHADNQNIGNKKFYVNGITGTTAGGGPDDIDQVDPFKATLQSSAHLSLPPFSTSYFVIDNQLALPIELLNFNANLLDNASVKLDWQTASEINNDYFIMERSINGNSWEELAKIDAVGNSSDLLKYSTFDYSPYVGVSYYRLKQVDFDGQSSYSGIRKIIVTDSSIELYPNPTENKITVSGNNISLEDIQVYNILGQEVTSITKRISLEESKVIIDLSNLNEGLYYIKTKTTINKVYKR